MDEGEGMTRYMVVALTVGVALAVACASTTPGSAARSPRGNAHSTPSSPPSAAQALRTCVDRWNQDNMVGWGPTLVSISVRRLRAREADHLGIYDHRPHCTASLAVFAPRDTQTGCSGEAVMPGHPKFCVSTEATFVCVINKLGGYECSRYADGARSSIGKRVLQLVRPARVVEEMCGRQWQIDVARLLDRLAAVQRLEDGKLA